MTEEKKTCFVVMGYGEKPDFYAQRSLDLDKTYHLIIKPTVEEAGLACVRADELAPAGSVGRAEALREMYRQLLTADVVIADLSTANSNAMYELGVRHGLRPGLTLVIAEDESLGFGVDPSQVHVMKYHHLGKSLGDEEAERMRKELKQFLLSVLRHPHNNSPVFKSLKWLSPAELGGAPEPAQDAAGGTKVCLFVVGFGKKVDHRTGRALDLDKTYGLLVRPAAEKAGLKCVRPADPSGEAYEQLLSADVAVFDLSTYNPDTFYKLGLRHALRSGATIIIAEEELQIPFNLSDFHSITVYRYRHLGEDLERDDLLRLQSQLEGIFNAVLKNQTADSPIYKFLDGLRPPRLTTTAPTGPTGRAGNED